MPCQTHIAYTAFMGIVVKIKESRTNYIVLETIRQTRRPASEQFEKVIDEILNEKPKGITLTFDMASVDYISSMGIRLILLTRKKLNNTMASSSLPMFKNPSSMSSSSLRSFQAGAYSPASRRPTPTSIASKIRSKSLTKPPSRLIRPLSSRTT
ncbi:STAS domain-containing protein [Rubritalea tangerina]|uniref:STAS domain-containing protein n=1 Tax=Rubritalea tangerina TaxID=430798 RepID=UPI003607A7E0